MITVNKTVRSKLVEKEVDYIYDQILENAGKGVSETSIWLDKDIYDEAINSLQKRLNDEGTEFTWKQLAPQYQNRYGGWVYPMSESMGGQKRRVIKISS